jgi:holin-like protein
MNLLKEIFIIFTIWLIGDIIQKVTKLSIPGSVIGMMLLFLLLKYNFIKVEKIKHFSEYMLKNLAFFFIPPGVALIDSFAVLDGQILKLLFIIISSTFLVVVITGVTVQILIKKEDNLL